MFDRSMGWTCSDHNTLHMRPCSCVASRMKTFSTVAWAGPAFISICCPSGPTAATPLTSSSWSFQACVPNELLQSAMQDEYRDEPFTVVEADFYGANALMPLPDGQLVAKVAAAFAGNCV